MTATLSLVFAFLLCLPAHAARAKKALTHARQAAAADPSPESEVTSFSLVADGAKVLPNAAPGAPLVTAFAQGGPVMRPYDDRPVAPVRHAGDLHIPVLPPDVRALMPVPRDAAAMKRYAVGVGATGALLILADLAVLAKSKKGDRAVREAERRRLHAETLRAERAESELAAERERTAELTRALEDGAGTARKDQEMLRIRLGEQKEELEEARRRLRDLEDDVKQLSTKKVQPVHDDVERSLETDHQYVVWANSLGVLLDRIDDSVRAIDSHLGHGRGADHVLQIKSDLQRAGNLVENVQTFLRAKSGDTISNVQLFMRKGEPPLV